MRIRRTSLVVLVVVTTLAALPQAASARSERSKRSRTAATLEITPNPVASGEMVTASGCGYVDGSAANVVIDADASTYFFPVQVTEGCIEFQWRPWDAGSQTWEIWQRTNGRKQKLMASTTLEVL